MNSLLFLARKFILGTQEKTVRAMLIMTVLSCIIGSCALALVAAVMNGFEQKTRSIIQGAHADLIINLPNKLHTQDIQKIYTKLEQDCPDYIAGITPYAHNYAITTHAQQSSVIRVTGIDPIREQTVSKLHAQIITPKNKTLISLLGEKSIVLGKELARALNVTNNSYINLLSTDSLDTDKDFDLKEERVLVTGIFATGIDDIDANTAICSLDTLYTLFPDTYINSLGIKTKNNIKNTQICVQKALHTMDTWENLPTPTVRSWKELYPALLSALTLEKYAMILILALIILISSMHIISLLFMLITHKKTELAILATLGQTKKELVSLFTIIGFILGLTTSIIGATCASFISYLLEHHELIKLPDVYYVSHVPAHITWVIILGVIVFTTLLGTLAAYLPARMISKLEIASVLKQIS